jgi:hypothetical protein
MYTGFSSQVTGFYAQRKSVEFSPEEKLSSARGSALGWIPGRTIRPQTGSSGAQRAYIQIGFLARGQFVISQD